MNRIQRIENSILIRLKQVLNENNLTYWLAYGTVLGSARHGGFIPWDDDVDIYLSGSDYAKLKAIFVNNNNDCYGLSLHDYETVPNYPYTFPKIIDNRTTLIENRFNHLEYKCGIYVDIFLLFPISNNWFIRNLGFIRRRYLYSVVESNYCKLKECSFIKRAIGTILKMKSPIKAQKKLYKYYQKKWNKKNIFLCEPLQFNDRIRHKTIFFINYDIGLFEGEKYRIPFDHRDYLNDVYGDYMQLPPVEKRCSPHSFVILDYGNNDK